MNLANAACRQPAAKNVNFFPEPADREGIAAAKAVCAGCAVRQECRATHFQEPFGVWFGTTESERRRLALQSERQTGRSLRDRRTLALAKREG